MNNNVYEELDITFEDGMTTYFERPEEWIEFYCKILEQFENLEKRGYKDICFNISPYSYTEYGDSYTDVKLVFNYTRELSELELLNQQKQEAKKLEDEKIFSELCGKLSTNSIGSIMQNEDLRKLYLEGDIKI